MINTITSTIYTGKTPNTLGGTDSFGNTPLKRFPRTAIGEFRGNVPTARSNYIENCVFSQNGQLSGANRHYNHFLASLLGWWMK